MISKKHYYLSLLFVFGFSFCLGVLVYRGGWITSGKNALLGWISGPSTESQQEQVTATPQTPLPMVGNRYLSLNEIPLDENEDPLLFMVAGHIYGSHDINDIHPAVTLLYNLQLINQMDPDMGFLLGDIVFRSNEKYFNEFKRDFLSLLNFPVSNAAGNHDMKNRALYESLFGASVFSFTFKQHLFINLDTTRSGCSIPSDQIEFIKNQITEQRAATDLAGIHLMMHHVVFLNKSGLSDQEIAQPNTACSDTQEFEEFIQEFLVPLSMEIPVYLYAGDVGAYDGNLSPYFEKRPGSNITQMAVGVGNSPYDAVIIARERDGRLLFEAFSLAGREMMPIENYSYSYWRNRTD
ncbi:MAG: hypothetical protein JXA25_10745 [Anaerolineales bacterium]|nr:hypothetical protein [Anaerolineales bacterium]